MARVVLAMSGGVDSSVAAHLLLEQGHDIIGVFMRHGEESAAACDLDSGEANPLLPLLQNRADHKQGCCSASDAEDARKVADKLSIPFYALNLQKDFSRIIDYFVDEYTIGRTPNPCVMCNNWIKFGRLFDYADSIDAEYVATGHYARLVHDQQNQIRLARGIDGTKDQAYVLFGIEQKYLSRMLLPVGGFPKTEIRDIARGISLRVADKKDSQEICFVTSGHHGDFVRQRRGEIDLSGEIITTDGTVVGRHSGIENYTIGQRKGLGVALGTPHYVVKINRDSRQVVLGSHDELGKTSLQADRTNWLITPEPEKPFRCQAQIRYNSAPQDATASISEMNGEKILQVTFDQSVHGIAPGQAVVCYDGNMVIGGGWIR
ncbi:MAG: tRNA 2-thiouridine(34) synthase MnmA [Pirellulaceae bacterium]|mgnify:CR=1 FL=1|jgi:tRNA-uridine 2-sulfurtransferase|nr:tRNA 2-thiouridine(34) synthase MnmA [Planctomycetaceae bacterium]MDB4862825.1 tRNA 2-thiouridine(34) synthase MnmA [Pirellulaceae bacterium]